MRSVKTRTIGIGMALAAVLAGCTRDPQVLKKKDVERGDAYLQKGKYNEAVIEYANAVKIDPRYSEAHYHMAQCFLKLGQFSFAYQELLRTVDIDPGNLRAQIDLGGLLIGAGKYADARDHIQAVLKSDPKNAEAQALLADADAPTDLPKAVAEAQQAVAMDASRANSYLNLAMLQERNKDFAAAEQNFRKAISLDPKSTAAMVLLGRFYASQKRIPEAEKQLQDAIAQEPKAAGLRANLASFYLSTGQKDKAEQTVLQAKQDLKDDPAAYRMPAEFYRIPGPVGQSHSRIRRALQRTPERCLGRKSLRPAPHFAGQDRRCHQGE